MQIDIIQYLRVALDRSRANLLKIEYEYDVPRRVTEFTVQLPESVYVTEFKGFDRDGQRFIWNDDVQCQITGHYEPDTESETGYKSVDRSDWAIISPPGGRIKTSWKYTGPSVGLQREYEVTGEGVISEDGAIAYLGPYRRHTTETPHEEIVLIEPAISDIHQEPEEILDCLRKASWSLEIGAYNDEVLMVAAPNDQTNWGPTGTQYGDEGFWVLDQTDINHPNNTWIHEYIHTRQNFSYDESIRWFIEGSANYFEAWVGVNQDRIGFREFCRYLSGTDDPSAVLSEPSSWRNHRTPYSKGTAVTAALATKVDLMQVFRELNTKPEGYEVGVEELKDILQKMDVDNIESWFDQFVQGPRMPDFPSQAPEHGL